MVPVPSPECRGVPDCHSFSCLPLPPTTAVGIAPNRMLAKICSDKNKPNGGWGFLACRSEKQSCCPLPPACVPFASCSWSV